MGAILKDSPFDEMAEINAILGPLRTAMASYKNALPNYMNAMKKMYPSEVSINLEENEKRIEDFMASLEQRNRQESDLAGRVKEEREMRRAIKNEMNTKTNRVLLNPFLPLVEEVRQSGVRLRNTERMMEFNQSKMEEIKLNLEQLKEWLLSGDPATPEMLESVGLNKAATSARRPSGSVRSTLSSRRTVKTSGADFPRASRLMARSVTKTPTPSRASLSSSTRTDRSAVTATTPSKKKKNVVVVRSPVDKSAPDTYCKVAGHLGPHNARRPLTELEMRLKNRRIRFVPGGGSVRSSYTQSRDRFSTHTPTSTPRRKVTLHTEKPTADSNSKSETCPSRGPSPSIPDHSENSSSCGPPPNANFDSSFGVTSNENHTTLSSRNSTTKTVTNEQQCIQERVPSFSFAPTPTTRRPELHRRKINTMYKTLRKAPYSKVQSSSNQRTPPKLIFAKKPESSKQPRTTGPLSLPLGRREHLPDISKKHKI